jgi:hypothetical protein
MTCLICNWQGNVCKTCGAVGEDEDLINRIVDAIQTDEDSDSENLKERYLSCTPEEQKAVDRVFIALCGWSLRTMMNGIEDSSYNPFE